MQNILSNDINYTFSKLSDDERARLKDATVLITGCAGFLGYYFMHFFDQKADELGIRKIIGLDNFMLGYPEWVKKLEQSPKVNIQKFDIIRDNIAGVQYAGEADYIIHLASVASPMFYRKYPIETLAARLLLPEAHPRTPLLLVERTLRRPRPRACAHLGGLQRQRVCYGSTCLLR